MVWLAIWLMVAGMFGEGTRGMIREEALAGGFMRVMGTTSCSRLVHRAPSLSRKEVG